MKTLALSNLKDQVIKDIKELVKLDACSMDVVIAIRQCKHDDTIEEMQHSKVYEISDMIMVLS